MSADSVFALDDFSIAFGTATVVDLSLIHI